MFARWGHFVYRYRWATLVGSAVLLALSIGGLLMGGTLTSGGPLTSNLESSKAANLVTTVWHGREKLHYLNAEPINAIADRWISQYDQPRVRALADLKKALEEDPMDKPSVVYATYISTTPERLWSEAKGPERTALQDWLDLFNQFDNSTRRRAAKLRRTQRPRRPIAMRTLPRSGPSR